MEVRPPEPAGGGLSVVSDPWSAVTEMRVTGAWSRQLCRDVYVALRQCLAEQPAAMIIDLGGLADLDATSAGMWLAASRAARMLRPPTDLALCIPPTRQLAGHLRRCGAVRFLPMHATMAHARAAVAGRLPPAHRLQLNRLDPKPGSAGVAADAVSLACAAWSLPDLVDTGREVMAELVADSVTHAGTEMTVAISLRGTGLHLAVHDGEAGGRLSAPYERSLSTLNAPAGAWGVAPARHGNVVWAIVRPRTSLTP
jgi:hypothetical protein